jgi:hypothetical protein
MSKKAEKSASKAKNSMSAEALDNAFESGGDVLDHFDSSKATKFVNVEFPVWMVKALDREADRLGIPRQAVIKTWIDEKLRQKAIERRTAANS